MISLTTSQQSVYDAIDAFAGSPDGSSVACLQGFAGTGKTTTIAKLVNELSTSKRIAVMAPTNKAVGVLQKKIGHDAPGVEFGSLHSFIGLRLKENEDGSQSCLPEGRSTIHEYDLAIVDECSMVSVQLFQTILQSKRHCKVLFVGDPAQLPPINDGNDSPVFRHINTSWRLTEIVRQAQDNPIIAASVRVRQAIEQGRRTQLADLDFPAQPSAAGISHGGIDTIVNFLIGEAKVGRDCRALGWRNHAVNAINSRVHAEMFPQCTTPFAVGEQAIARSEFLSVRELDIPSVRIFTSEEVSIVDIQPGEHPNFEIPAWRILAKRDTGDLFVVHLPQDAQALRNEINTLWAAYHAAKRAGQHDARNLSKNAWALVRAFAPLSHCYAMTTHKSQGSTFDTVLIHWGDLSVHRDDYEFNRMLYVAMTRASKYLAIVTI